LCTRQHPLRVGALLVGTILLVGTVPLVNALLAGGSSPVETSLVESIDVSFLSNQLLDSSSQKIVEKFFGKANFVANLLAPISYELTTKNYQHNEETNGKQIIIGNSDSKVVR